MINHYQILSVPMDASPKQLKDAYKKMAILFHPDKNLGNKTSEERFKQINESYQILSNLDKRAQYDLKLKYFLFESKRTREKSARAPQSTHSAKNYQQAEPVYQEPNFKAGDYSDQGRHYQQTYYDHNKRSSLNYVIAFTLIIIIAVGALLFGLMMNTLAAKEHYKEAKLHVETEDYLKALFELNKAIEFDKEYSDAFLLRAEIKYRYGKFESALPDFNLAIKYGENIPNEVFIKRDFCRVTAQKSLKKSDIN